MSMRNGFLPVLLALACLLASAWMLGRASVRVPLDGQRLQVRLPDTLPVQVDVIDARALSAGDAKNRGVPVHLDETLRLDIAVDPEVPLALTVRYQGQIPVRTQVAVDTTMETRVLGLPMQLPVKGTIPLELDLPVDLTIPIRQPVRLQFEAPVTARLDQTVHIPFKAGLDAHIRFGDAPIALTIADGEFHLPVKAIGLR